jgi:hypothetical protein
MHANELNYVQEDAALQGVNLDEMYPYVLNDQGFGLRNRPFNLTVSWNIMPCVGENFQQQSQSTCSCCLNPVEIVFAEVHFQK